MHLENATGARTTKHGALANEGLHAFSIEVHKTTEKKEEKGKKNEKRNKTKQTEYCLPALSAAKIPSSVCVCVWYVFTFFIFLTDCVCSLRYKVHVARGGLAEESILLWL